MGSRCVQADGLKSQPGGTSGPAARAAGLTPGAAGTATAKAMTRAPTSVSFAYTAALGVQNTSGAKSSQLPSAAQAQRAQPAPRDSENRPHTRISRPVTMSLAAMRASATPKALGLKMSHRPSAALAKWHHKVRRWRSSAMSQARCTRPPAGCSMPAACSSHCGTGMRFARYQAAGRAFKRATIVGSVARSERAGSQPSSARAREMSSS